MRRHAVLALAALLGALGARSDSTYALRPGEAYVPLEAKPIPVVVAYLDELNKKEDFPFEFDGSFRLGEDVVVIATSRNAPSCCHRILLLQVSSGGIRRIAERGHYNCAVVRTKEGRIRIVAFSRAQPYPYYLRRAKDGSLSLTK